MHLPPLRFKPILKPRTWGGDRFDRPSDLPETHEVIGESWTLADLPTSTIDGRSVVADGAMAGRSLHEILTSTPNAVLGSATPTTTGGFPLLVKILDAAENLSVQVHPTPAYVEDHPDAAVKTESWFVLEAEPDAVVYRGLRPGVDADVFQRAITSERGFLDLLVEVPVAAGDCIHLPSGICHALGAGVRVVEIQTPSDTTFRVWDWDRADPARPLHRDAAMKCIAFGASTSTTPSITRLSETPAVDRDGVRRRRLCTAGEFTIDHLDLDPGTHPVTIGATPVILVGLEGTFSVVDAEGDRTRCGPEDTVLLPASAASPKIECDSTGRVLLVELPATPGVHLA
jgi:mannose-6-phosphate isomerase